MTSNGQSIGQLRHEPRVLLGPGPSNVHPRVFQAMTSPILGYLDPDFLAVMDDSMELLRHLFQTKNEVAITLPGTGMSAMEASISFCRAMRCSHHFPCRSFALADHLSSASRGISHSSHFSRLSEDRQHTAACLAKFVPNDLVQLVLAFAGCAACHWCDSSSALQNTR